MKALRQLVALALLGGSCFAQTRTVTPFNTDWKFFKGDAEGASAVQFSDAAWQPVTLPHTWNAQDALPGNAMYQGPAWYRKQFAALPVWRGRRVFIRFGAASLAAEVYLNGSKLGEHQGGFAAFCFEITAQLKFDGMNTLAVRVDNRRGAISPLGGDFTIYGGLYRPVSLIVTGPVNITPLDYAGPGVYLKQTAVNDMRAEVEVVVKVSNATKETRYVTAKVTILNPKDKIVLTTQASGVVKSGATDDVSQSIALQKPHLWDGTDDPYLHTARVELIENGKRVDEVDQPLGLRYFRVDPAKGFMLNGEPMQIHGVCLHQEGPNGWAVTEKDEDADMAMLREMGANGVRLVHYQHSDHFHSLCDREGVLAWSELALVNNIHYTDAFRQNVRQQLIELIRQNFNHPSIVMWSMYNEISSRTESPTLMVKELNELAHAEDPTRPTTGAASGDTMANLPDVINALDLIALNIYDGWYGGKPEDLGPDLDKYNQKYGSKGVALSEYGAGASIHQHQQGLTQRPDPNGRFHPEEWQAIQHEIQLPIIKARPYVWGSFLWVMFDFASAGRHEGDTDGINDKGLVTRDRAVKKDAFYFYKANWNPDPMAYITSRRDAERTTAATAIKVYSNCPKITLKVNGKPYDPPMKAPHVFVLDGVTLSEGENTIEAEGNINLRFARDSCKWVYRAAGAKGN
jgi:beta-galactosidase